MLPARWRHNIQKGAAVGFFTIPSVLVAMMFGDWINFNVNFAPWAVSWSRNKIDAAACGSIIWAILGFIAFWRFKVTMSDITFDTGR